MLRRIKKFFRRTKLRYDYHTLYHRVGRRLGRARAERRQLLIENEGLRERMQKQFTQLLDVLHDRKEMKRQIADMRKQLEATATATDRRDVQNPNLPGVEQHDPALLQLKSNGVS
jgi:hypothetical protein